MRTLTTMAASALAGFADYPASGEALAVLAPAALVAGALAPDRRALPAQEADRIARFRLPQDRREREAAHGLLRHLLGGMLGRAPASLVLGRDALGRPFLPGAGDLDLNLSHGAGWVAVALARGGRIGVDVEGGTRPVDWDALGPHFLHPDELAAFRTLPAPARPDRALELWAVKEACLKASGEGLSAVPQALKLEPARGGWRLERPGYRFAAASLRLEDGARFAWATEDHLGLQAMALS